MSIVHRLVCLLVILVVQEIAGKLGKAHPNVQAYHGGSQPYIVNLPALVLRRQVARAQVHFPDLDIGGLSVFSFSIKQFLLPLLSPAEHLMSINVS